MNRSAPPRNGKGSRQGAHPKSNKSDRSVIAVRQFFKRLVCVEQCLTDKQWDRLARRCKWRPRIFAHGRALS
jgi:hypothetical protein